MAQRFNITKTFLSQIVPPSTGKDRYWDDDLTGFGVRVLPSGTMSYIVVYRTDKGQSREETICRTKILAPLEARKIAKKKLGQVAGGADPIGERRQERIDRVTLEAMAEEYIKRRCSGKKSGPEDERVIRKDMLPAWGKVPAKNITRRMVIEMIDDIRDRGAMVMANRTLSVIKRVFNFGIDRDLVEHNPTVRVYRTKEQGRQRVLDNDEIKHFWNRADQMKRATLYTETALKLILVTGQRPGEIVEMEWGEIEARWWIIPAEKSKNGWTHRVPLSPLALELLSALPRDGRYAFPRKVGSGYDGEEHMNEKSLPQAVSYNVRLFDIPHWTPHDLRRTAASKIASMGASNETIDKILNHVLPGVRGVYNRHGYDAEKRAALDAWGEKIGQILRGKGADVVPMVR